MKPLFLLNCHSIIIIVKLYVNNIIWLLPDTEGIRDGLLVFNGYRVLDGKGENVPETDGGDGCTTA